MSIDQIRGMEDAKPTRLERQVRLKQIHKMIILGLTLKEMAQRLGCNERTVRRDIVDIAVRRRQAAHGQRGSRMESGPRQLEK